MRRTGAAVAPAPSDPLAGVGTPAATPSPLDPSGVPMPVGNLPGWRQVFASDFTADVPRGGFSGCTVGRTMMNSVCAGLPASVAAKWWAYPDGWPDTEHNGQYEPSRVLSIHNGLLDYYIHTADHVHMVAAVVPKIPGGVDGGGLLYGAYVVRFKAEPVYGYKTAWLLWPDHEHWPGEGEIDFPEGDLSGTIDGFMHHLGATSGSQQDVYSTGASYDTWHTATIEWTPDRCRFMLDGAVIGTSTRFVPADPMHWVLQTETATDGTAPSEDSSGHVYVAWAVAYTQDP